MSEKEKKQTDVQTDLVFELTSERVSPPRTPPKKDRTAQKTPKEPRLALVETARDNQAAEKEPAPEDKEKKAEDPSEKLLPGGDYTAAECAEILGVNVYTVRLKIREGLLKPLTGAPRRSEQDLKIERVGRAGHRISYEELKRFSRTGSRMKSAFNAYFGITADESTATEQSAPAQLPDTEPERPEGYADGNAGAPTCGVTAGGSATERADLIADYLTADLTEDELKKLIEILQARTERFTLKLENLNLSNDGSGAHKIEINTTRMEYLKACEELDLAQLKLMRKEGQKRQVPPSGNGAPAEAQDMC